MPSDKRILIFIFAFFLVYGNGFAQVTVTDSVISIPTYQVMDPDPNPVFFSGRRYQGAKGKVYPYPLIHNLTDSVANQDYQAVIIENEYIEVCILPQLGGRIHYARDKRNDYYFLYYNRVVKPALIGMTGAWISGGVEWNIPHHHRASSFMPVEYSVTENPGGSSTVWVGETELRHRSRWIVGITLHPGSTLVETTVRVFNTTPYQNSIMAWANAAVHASDEYQVFFPPLTQYVTFHRKNQFSEWPESNQYYDGADYTLGADISRWENHIKSTSFFEWGNKGNFVAGIDHGMQAGTVIFGNKYMNPGKKIWSWGNNPSGAMWDQLLTDEDGPYIELMFGSFSDNQPDYSWIQARETRESRYWFAPLINMKGIKKVNEFAIADIEIVSDSLFAVINVVSRLGDAEINIFRGDDLIHNQVVDIDPAEPWVLEMMVESLDDMPGAATGEYEEQEAPGNIRIILKDDAGRTILSYTLEQPEAEPMPEPVSTPTGADDINDPDSLYYAGLKFEQFHDPYFMPMDFYQKAMEIKPDHVPSLTRAGMMLLKAGDYENAAANLAPVVDMVTSDYTVPENAAPLYYLALAYLELDQEGEAYDLFAMAAWDYSFRSAAFYQLALLDSKAGNYQRAIEHLVYAGYANARSTDILSLLISMHRLNGENAIALELAGSLLELDPVNLNAHYEKFLLTSNGGEGQRFESIMRGYHENYLELAVYYGNAGMLNEAVDLLEQYLKLPEPGIKDYPMVFYYLGYYNHISGNQDKAGEYFQLAANADHQYCFPFRLESVRVLKTALEYDPDDALAWYLIGNIYYDHQPALAMEAWQSAVSISDEIPVAYRNLAFAFANIENDAGTATENIKQAIDLNPDDPRYYYEYDLYLKAMLADPAERLESFSSNHEVVVSDQLSIFPYAGLLTVTGNHKDAIALMSSNTFHRWEGGESIYLYWLYAHLFEAAEALENNRLAEADSLLESALSYPLNLQAVTSSHENIAFYYKGLVAEKLGRNTDEAEFNFLRATQSKYGDPECDYYAALAYQKLKKIIATESIFEHMVEGGQAELLEGEDMDFFDPFSRERSKNELQANAYLRIALGYRGMGDGQNASKYFELAREHNPALMSLVFGK